MPEEDARARIAAQPDREARLAVADLVVDNAGDLDHLRSEVDRVWEQLEELRRAAAAAPGEAAEPATPAAE
jgi:dephospho-CoA kinase